VKKYVESDAYNVIDEKTIPKAFKIKSFTIQQKSK
jgi:hypothetical protein